ncbi:MAG: hypothetical protein CMG74_04435 [Candidatus Marinimicrobia bacterium]|nr:hypothetical protein [Candidatus Neomarinimicrobiota bacterium]|tara:strand:- start:1818 stop:5129 length:3312 start_codon:yes stop_codon:yes gene_type:complete
MILKYIKIIISVTVFSTPLLAWQWIDTGSDVPAEPVWNIESYNNNEIKIIFNLSGYYIDLAKKGETRITFPGGAPILEKGSPDLPCIAKSIIISDLSNMELEITDVSYIDVPLSGLLPSKGNITRNVRPSSIAYTYGKVYETDLFFPQEIAFLRDPYILRSVRGQAIVFQPLQYNPVTQIMRVYTQIKTRIYERGLSVINPLVQRSLVNNITREYKNIYDQHFLNFTESSIRYEPVEEGSRMLIICYGPFMEAMQPLVEWKNIKGIKTELVDIASIGQTAYDIDEFVESYYYEQGLTYLLLVGDIDQIPSMRFSEGAGSNSPADPAYGFIAGDDYYPDIFVGRFSAEDTSHVNTMVSRTINYERYPDIVGDWYRKGSGFASNEGPGDDGEYDNEHMDIIRQKLLGYNYDEVDQVYDPSGTVNDGEAAINEGRSIINYTGHGTNSAWGNGCPMNNTDVNGLINIGKLPFIWTVACVTGEFHIGTCFAETWLRATAQGEPTGAVASFNSTVNAAWNPPMDAQDEMNDIFVESYENNIKRTFGGLSFNGCMHMNDNYGSAGDVETLYWTIFGDPSLVVRSNVPSGLVVSHENIIIVGSTEFIVQTGNSDALAAISKNGILLGSAYSDETGVATIVFDEPVEIPGQLNLVVTAYNSLPYETSLDVIAPSGPYIVMDDWAITSGGNNGRLGFGQISHLSIGLENIGAESSNDILVSLQHNDDLVAFNIDSLTIESLEAGADTIIGPFEFQVSFNVEDQSAIDFILLITSGELSWEFFINLLVDAPDHQINSITVFDGDNAALDPGESVTVQLIMENSGHAPLTYPTFNLFSNDPYLSVGSTESNNAFWWDIGSQVIVTSEINASEDSPVPYTAILDLAIGSLNTNYEYYLPVSISMGLLMEDFESGNFEAFDWKNSEIAAPWTIQEDTVFSGLYAAKSGIIENSQATELSLDLNIPYDGVISFFAKTSTEQGASGNLYDYLAFYIDNDMVIYVGGNTDWNNYVSNVPAGERSFKWVYHKDQAQSTGDDCIWLDRIIFPAGAFPILNIDFGDLNGDENVNVLDIIMTVANVLGYTEFNTDQILSADMNIDGIIDIFDIMLIVNKALYAE